MIVQRVLNVSLTQLTFSLRERSIGQVSLIIRLSSLP